MNSMHGMEFSLYKKAAASLGRKARRPGETLFYAFAVAIRSFILLSWFVVLTLAS